MASVAKNNARESSILSARRFIFTRLLDLTRRVTKTGFQPRIGNEDSRSDAPPSCGGCGTRFFGIGLFKYSPSLFWAFALGGHFNSSYLAGFSLDQKPYALAPDPRFGVDQSSDRSFLHDTDYLWGSGGGPIGEAFIATDVGLFQGGPASSSLVVA